MITLIFSYLNLNKESECLKPIALEVCNEEGLVYKNNDDQKIWCYGDDRVARVKDFLFYEYEKENCEFGFFTGMKK